MDFITSRAKGRVSTNNQFEGISKEHLLNSFIRKGTSKTRALCATNTTYPPGFWRLTTYLNKIGMRSPILIYEKQSMRTYKNTFFLYQKYHNLLCLTNAMPKTDISYVHYKKMKLIPNRRINEHIFLPQDRLFNMCVNSCIMLCHLSFSALL